MEIEAINAMNEGMSVLMKLIALITLSIAGTGFAVYLAGITWLWLTEGRRRIAAPRTTRRIVSPKERKSFQLLLNTRVEPVLSTNPAHIPEAT